MESKAHALAAGLFAIALGAAAILGLFWFGGKKQPTQDYLVVTRQNVSGLNVQGQVRYRGIRVGKVKDIRLDRENIRNILIQIEIDEAVPVTRGTVAKLSYQGVTGLAHVLLEDSGANAALLAPDAPGQLPRIAMAPSLIEELGESGTLALKQARVLMDNANQLLNDDNRKRFSATLANLESTTARLNTVLSDERVQRLGPAIARFEDAAGNARQLFTEARSVVPRIQALSEKIDAFVGDPSSDGATAAVARINDMASELTVASRQLNRVLRVIEQSPDSVLFGSPTQRPGPGEPGFSFGPGGNSQP